MLFLTQENCDTRTLYNDTGVVMFSNFPSSPGSGIRSSSLDRSRQG